MGHSAEFWFAVGYITGGIVASIAWVILDKRDKKCR